MYYKIICCPCYTEWFISTEQVISVKTNFCCYCNRLHKIYVWTCPSHSFVYILQNSHTKCFCNECMQYEICAVCVEKRYNLNYRCRKFCLNYLHERGETLGITLNYFLDQKMDSEPFFYFKNNLVCFSLDNPDIQRYNEKRFKSCKLILKHF